ncbi:MAG: PAS domain-containing protein [Chloroflexi bacterium]|nr:PAS domain-containing protein [Chloroflexota bacterium]
MFEVSLDVILMIDAADGTVLDANPAATIALGYPLADLIGGSWSRLFNKRYPPYANDVRSAAAGGGTVVLTHRFRHANGRFVPMDLTAILLEPGDETRSGPPAGDTARHQRTTARRHAARGGPAPARSIRA